MITRALANISQGLEECLYMGNLDAKRDWGHAKDYVRMQWMMLQQDEPKDYVIATGVQYSVREFIEKAAAELGISIRWQGEGVDEVGVVEALQCAPQEHPGLTVGSALVRIDKRYFRPSEVETLLGDPSKAKEDLGWMPEITLEEMVREMVAHDLDQAKRHALLHQNGYSVMVSKEN